jgi:hypothetical protein
MQRQKTLWLSAASGCVWAVIGLTVGFLVASSPALPTRGLGRLVLIWGGGIIASPLIGLLMGQLSRIFGYFEEVFLRIIVAGASLYVAMVLFIIASFLTQFVLNGRLPANPWTSIFGSAAAAFELTCIVLWPLAYLNHTLISRLWVPRSPSKTVIS